MVETISLENLTTGNVQEVGMGRFDFVLDKVNWGSIKADHSTSSYLNQIGKFLVSTSLGTRDVTITGWVVGDTPTQLSERKRFLNHFFNPLHKHRVIYNNYYLEGTLNSSIKYGTSSKENNDVFCKFMVSILCTDPLFYRVSPSLKAIATWLPKFKFPLHPVDEPGKRIIFGLRSPSRIVTLSNGGDAPCGLSISLVARGTVENPSLTLIETQETFRLKFVMDPGDQIAISTIPNKKGVDLIRGDITRSAFEIIDYLKTTFFQLPPGDSSLQYDADSGLDNLEVTVSYTPGFLEVQEA